MDQWIIFYNPSDYPGKYVTQKWHITVAEDAVVTDTLDQARAGVPPNLYKLPRFDKDEPVVVEVWL